MPVVGVTVTLVLLLLHVPPVGVALSVVLVPGHTVAVPVMAEGGASVVTVVVVLQPVGSV
jgi:hypothetical protein